MSFFNIFWCLLNQTYHLTSNWIRSWGQASKQESSLHVTFLIRGYSSKSGICGMCWIMYIINKKAQYKMGLFLKCYILLFPLLRFVYKYLHTKFVLSLIMNYCLVLTTWSQNPCKHQQNWLSHLQGSIVVWNCTILK